MIIQPFSGEAADIAYLFANDTAKILIGNPDQIAELIRCAPFRRRFTSFVLSFNEPLVETEFCADDNNGILNLTRLMSIVVGIRKIIAPAGQSERLAFLAVIHSDKGRTEVHILIVNVDLATNRQYSPYVHLRDAARLRNYQEYINLKFGFSDPEDLERQLKSMPDPRRTHFELISEITTKVQNYFKDARNVTVNDVADYLSVAGYCVQTTTPEGKKKRLVVVTDEGREVRLPGVWFRQDFDLVKLRSRKRRTLPELVKSLRRRIKRFKELTGKSHRQKSNNFVMEQLPRKIRIPLKLRSFVRFFSMERWKDRQISILPEILLWDSKRRSEWACDIGTLMKFPPLEVKQLFLKGLPLSPKILTKAPPALKLKGHVKKECPAGKPKTEEKIIREDPEDNMQ